MARFSHLLVAVLLLPAAVHSQSFTALGSWEEATCRAVAYQEPLIYYGNGSWLEIVDYADPTSPATAGRLLLPDNIAILEPKEDILYVGSEQRRLFVVDVSDPSNPTIVREIPDRSYAVEVFEDVLFVSSSGEIDAYDVQDPRDPQLASSFNTSSVVTRLVAEPGRLYALTGFGTVSIIDASDPANLQPLGAVTRSRITDFDVQGERLYTIYDSLVVYDISVPSSPRQVFAERRFNRGVAARDNRLYTFNLNGELHLYDLADPDSPVFVSEFNVDHPREMFSGSPGEATFVSDRLLLADRELGALVVDVEDTLNPQQVALFPVGGLHLDVGATADLAVVAAGGPGLLVLDITDPTNPIQVQRLRGVVAREVVVRDRLALVAGRSTAILERAEGPFSVVRTFDFRSSHVAVSGNRAYFTIVGPDETVGIFNIGTPESASEIGRLPPLGFIEGLAVNDQIAAIAVFDSTGVVIYDIQDPENPQHLSTVPIEARINDVFLDGATIYVGTAEDTIVLDVTDPSNPIDQVTLDAVQYAVDFAKMKALLLALNREAVYYQDPSVVTPSLVQGTGYEGAGDALAVLGNLVVVARMESGITLFDVEGIVTDRDLDVVPRTRSPLSAFPNPFSRELRFQMHSDWNGMLEVFDVMGRAVRTLSVDQPGPGNMLVWDGLDDSGRSVPDGLYLWRYHQGDHVERGAIVRVR